MAYSTIPKPSLYFNTKLYTGNQTANTAITGVGFQPDWTWIKRREINWHCLVDAVRGATKRLSSNATNTEVTDATAVTSLDSDGFTIGIDSNGYTNQNGGTYASWNWKANGTGSANTDGTISSTVSANTTSGFSIVSFTGNSGTVGHGLGVKPDMIIVKSRQSTTNWVVMHKGLGNMDTNILVLNTTTGADSGGAGMAEPTSSVFTMTSGLSPNDNLIAYCFAGKTGYSKFGSYTGNGNADGTFVYTGFKPAWVMVKKTSGTGNWFLFDNKRNTFNVVTTALSPDLSDADNNMGNVLDFLSNGFKFRDSYGGYNDGSFIFMAFAEEPLVANSGTDAVPATAR